ncbi:hypothetical protein SOCE26_061880 [Sorangium cellulosum]|uniref:Uncharacterized protein n=1 Tax=Sorangium cellulosum TaxID=56 RepID=A0A2L0EZI8_SORCE|nr:hypothetical protein [Sorangium cellulosum]AUX44721.1 hypothetical protein SOCE26_061880 [Sorangium cellulosum]
MRIREKVVAAGCLAVAACLLAPREAAAQTTVERDENWATVSDVSLVLGTSVVFLMPRVYYSDPEATVGWKGRWHFSVLAPAMTMTALTLLVDLPIKGAIESTRPGCSVDETKAAVLGSGCESFGGPSTHAFASWGATGAGTGIFLVDTFRYSSGRFNAGGFIGNVAFPLTASVVTSIARGVAPSGKKEHETAGQIAIGGATGFLSGLAIGTAYAFLQRPNCGYGNALFCW